MTRPRSELISLEQTPFYHIHSRCVRRAFLCGFDELTGRNFEHRRQWIVDRIRMLSSIFAIDIAAYAVMSNHYHLVLKCCPDQLGELSDDAIIERWCCLFKGPLLIQRFREGEALSAAELATIADIATVWRLRLASISWFMRCLNQPIARQANLEDNCTGKFWECRFKSQALYTEEALLSCMAYVDLNPLRAGLANSPESSDYTSIHERITPAFLLQHAQDEQCRQGDLQRFTVPLKPLMTFDGDRLTAAPEGISFGFRDYLELVNWSGRIIRPDKRGSIDTSLPPILQRLRLSIAQWRENTTQFERIHARRFNRAVGCLDSS